MRDTLKAGTRRTVAPVSVVSDAIDLTGLQPNKKTS